MSKKFLVLIVVILLAVGYYFAVYLDGSGSEEDAQLTITSNEMVEIVHVFSDGVHTLSGDIMVATPCHALSYEVIVLKESYPEDILIEFTSDQMSEICASVMTPAPFEIIVEASQNATFEATYKGQGLSLDMKDPPVVGEDVFSGVTVEEFIEEEI